MASALPAGPAAPVHRARPQPAGTRTAAEQGLAGPDPLRGDFLLAGKTRGSRRRLQLSYLCRHERHDAGGISEDPQSASDLFSGGKATFDNRLIMATDFLCHLPDFLNEGLRGG